MKLIANALLWLVALFPALAAAESPPAPTKFDIPAIDAYLAGQVAEKGHVGLSVAIMREGKIVFAKGYGKRSLEPALPVDTDSMFGIGSVTKQFTCACIFMLAEQGKLSIHDPVAKYYPKLTSAKEITLLDLMGHTSGYTDYYPLDFLDRRMLKSIEVDHLITEYAGTKLDFEPRTRYSYSNTGYMILGRIVEKVSGQPLGKFMEEKIFKPLKMEHTRFEPASDVQDFAKGYTSFAFGASEPAKREADGWIGAAGGIFASASDLARWDLGLIDGKVVKPESYLTMTTSQELKNGRKTGYGCGLRTFIREGEPVLQHTGAVSGYLAYNTILPRTKSAVVVLGNTEHVSPASLNNLLLGLVVKDMTDKEAPTVPKINGPEPKKAALEFLHQMQTGKLERDKLGEEFSIFLTEERLKSGGARLKELGEPTKVEVDGVSERGGMEVASIRMTFKDATLHGLLYRSTDGKIQQLLFSKE